MKKIITAYEASQKHGFSMGYIRRLMREGVINGRQAQMNPKGYFWLIEETSLKHYLSKKRKPGRKPKKKR